MNNTLKIILIGFFLNFIMVFTMFMLDEAEIVEWSVYFTIPIGVTNGLLMTILMIKNQKKKETEKLR